MTKTKIVDFLSILFDNLFRMIFTPFKWLIILAIMVTWVVMFFVFSGLLYGAYMELIVK